MFEGLLVGLMTFGLIGLFHPVVIKGEYYFGRRIGILFFICGICSGVLSVFTDNIWVSIISGLFACCFFWSVAEVRQQEKRVLAGRFPIHPSRRAYYERLGYREY